MLSCIRMLNHYLIKRLLHAIPILLVVNFLTFLLFFMVNTPDDMASMHFGYKYLDQEAIAQWKHLHGYDLPYFFNQDEKGIEHLRKTLFYTKTIPLFEFDFGLSTQGRAIGQDLAERAWPSLAIALPALVLSLIIRTLMAIAVILIRHSRAESWALTGLIAMMSISSLFYIIFFQFLIGNLSHLTPISGYQEGVYAFRFVALPIFLSILIGLGGGTRFYRSLLLETLHQEYSLTAKARGLSSWQILWRHNFPNALIPIITSVVALIPLLFMGSFLLESFFAIPGLGSYTLDAIAEQDFEIIRVMVFIGTLCYLIGLILTDLAYTWADPRIRLDDAL